jgi:hypothetical protein
MISTRRSIAIAAATFLVSLLLNWWIRPGPSVLEGRWYRVEPVLSEIEFGSWPTGAELIGDPMPSLPTLEFRPGGELRVLVTVNQTQPMLVQTLAYTRTEDAIEIAGRCWRGREPFPCAARYRYTLVADRLTLNTWVYARHGPPSDPPAPPLPLPAPTRTL